MSRPMPNLLRAVLPQYKEGLTNHTFPCVIILRFLKLYYIILKNTSIFFKREFRVRSRITSASIYLKKILSPHQQQSLQKIATSYVFVYIFPTIKIPFPSKKTLKFSFPSRNGPEEKAFQRCSWLLCKSTRSRDTS